MITHNIVPERHPIGIRPSRIQTDGSGSAGLLGNVDELSNMMQTTKEDSRQPEKIADDHGRWQTTTPLKADQPTLAAALLKNPPRRPRHPAFLTRRRRPRCGYVCSVKHHPPRNAGIRESGKVCGKKPHVTRCAFKRRSPPHASLISAHAALQRPASSEPASSADMPSRLLGAAEHHVTQTPRQNKQNKRAR